MKDKGKVGTFVIPEAMAGQGAPGSCVSVCCIAAESHLGALIWRREGPGQMGKGAGGRAAFPYCFHPGRGTASPWSPLTF